MHRFALMMVSRPKILVASTNIFSFGGSEMVCVRAIESLQAECDITLVHTGGALDTDRIAAWSGKRLDPARVQFITAPCPTLPGSLGNWALIGYAFALRQVRAMAPHFDLITSYFGECPIEHPNVLQYVPYPQFFFDKESLLYLGVEYSNPAKYGLRALYVMAARSIA
ncbi:MAG: hypothetical protein WAW96_21460, partial [Alphaproteobacteria bacterium]